MAGRVQKCPICREPLIENLVYKNGARRRTRVTQCPNHCDLKCPNCDELVRVTSTRIHERSLKCKNCEWRGHVPDRLFKEREKRSIEKQKCRTCRETLSENLVYKKGKWSRRTRVVQCPNHCDLKCPNCDELVRVTGTRIHERSLKCKNCEWKGHVPDRRFVKSKEAARLKFIESASGARRSGSLSKLSGSECPHCSQALLYSKTTMPSLKSGYEDVKYRLECMSKECDSMSWEEVKTVLAEVLPSGKDLLKPRASKIETKCQSCGQLILYDGRCRCS